MFSGQIYWRRSDSYSDSLGRFCSLSVCWRIDPSRMCWNSHLVAHFSFPPGEPHFHGPTQRSLSQRVPGRRTGIKPKNCNNLANILPRTCDCRSFRYVHDARPHPESHCHCCYLVYLDSCGPSPGTRLGRRLQQEGKFSCQLTSPPLHAESLRPQNEIYQAMRWHITEDTPSGTVILGSYFQAPSSIPGEVRSVSHE